MICIQGLLFFLYPVLGHVADVRLSRYCTIKTSVVLLVVSGVLTVVIAGSDSVVSALAWAQAHTWQSLVCHHRIVDACMCLHSSCSWNGTV